MSFPRRAGILLHPTSLPGEYGIGDLGPSAYSFVDFLSDAGQTYWQMLPLGPTGYGDSPYNCYSAFAGNTLLISPEKLIEEELLTPDQIADVPDLPADRVDYGGVYEWKNKMLSLAFEGFQRRASGDLRNRFESFRKENAWWLDDYALYKAIKFRDHSAWYEWPDPLKFRDKAAMNEAASELKDQVLAEKLYQFLFFTEWESLKEYANEHGVSLVGDIPIFVARDSADVWCNQGQFKLNKDGSPLVVSGVPPDFFSSTGQLWGNPIYDWDAMQKDDFRWWTARVAFTLRTVDVVRIDHFRGFAAVWEVPGKDKTAEKGKWVEVPGTELFATLRKHLGTVPFIVEDLGVITPDVEELRDGNDLPGMKILQFAFSGNPHDQYLPHNYPRNCVAYTGTHDNDTVAGWWQSQIRRGSKGRAPELSNEGAFCKQYLKTDGQEIHWDFIRAVWSSVADTAIAQLQDVIGVGNEGRMNLPASTGGNWSWRFSKDALTKERIEKLRELTIIYGRAGDQPSD